MKPFVYKWEGRWWVVMDFAPVPADSWREALDMALRWA